MTSALCGLSSVCALVLVAGQILAPPQKTYAEERYDGIDHSIEDGEVFALDGVEAEQGTDDFLLAPTDQTIDAPSGDPTGQTDGSASTSPVESEQANEHWRQRAIDDRLREAQSIVAIGERLGVRRTNANRSVAPPNPTPNSRTQNSRTQSATTPNAPLQEPVQATLDADLRLVRMAPEPRVAQQGRSEEPELQQPISGAGPSAARGLGLRVAENGKGIERATQKVEGVAPTPAATPIPENGDTLVNTAKSDPPRESKRNLVAVLGGRAKLDARHWPLLGDPSSEYVLVELFDYTCPHCRKMNQHLQAARHRYPSLAVMTLPVPLSQECNPTVSHTKARHHASCELARLAIAVWRIDPQKFEAFHEWLFIPEHGRSAGEAWAFASQLVGNEPLQAEMAKPTVNQFIAKHIELYKRAGEGTVPKLMFPRVTIRGEMNSPEALYGILERELFTTE